MKNIRQIFLFSLLFFISCKQEKQEVPPSFPAAKSQDEIIAFAKQKYDAKYSKGRCCSDGAEKKIMLWKKSFIQRISGKSFLVTPLIIPASPYTYLEEGTRISLSNASLLVSSVYADSVEFEVIIKIPDREYLLSEKNYPEFTGSVFVEDIFGNYKKGFQIKSGKPTLELIKGQKTHKNPGKSLATLKPAMECQIVDWYSCSTNADGTIFSCQYVYTQTYCVGPSGNSGYLGGGLYYGTIGQGTDSGGGASAGTNTIPVSATNPSNIPGNGYAGLCANTISWKKIGNGWTAQVQELGVTAIYSGSPDPIHTPEGGYIDVTFANTCITMPAYNLTSTQASREFAIIFNHASVWIGNELDSGALRPTYMAVRSRLLELIRNSFNQLHPGSTFVIGTCSGTVTNSRAGYGC